MSEFWQGPGWWLASDGRWYPPEQHPDYGEPPAVAPPPTPPALVPPVPPEPVPPEPVAPGPVAPGPGGVAGPTPYGHPEMQSPYGVGPWAGPGVLPITSGLAIAALVMGILWIGGVGSVVAVILGLVALAQIRSSAGRTTGRGLAKAAVVVGAVGMAGTVALVASGVVSTSQSALSPTASPAAGAGAPALTPASSAVIRELTGVRRSVVGAVGVPPQSLVTPPTIRIDQPKLVVDGKPGAVFIGGVFCPYCAAERWAIIMAFSRFGTFSNLEETTSSPWDVDPATATFSFHGATYSSRYVGLAMAEHSGNDVDGPDTHADEDPLTRQEAELWQTYDNSYGYPFLDIGNKALVLAPSFDPSVLAGFDQQSIAARLANADDPSTQAIVGTANYLTAAICTITDLKPASVCLVPAVVKAEQAMALSPEGRLTVDITGPRPSAGDGSVGVGASAQPGQHL